MQNHLPSSLRSKNINIKIYRIIIFLVVLYGCEIWSLILREEGRLGVMENSVMRRKFGPKSDEVTGEWRKLHNEELNDLYSSVIKLRRIRQAGKVARIAERRGAYTVSVGKHEGKKPRGRPRRRRSNNITMKPQEVGWVAKVWIDLAQNRDRCRALVIAVMNLRVP